jgi:carboxylate-amine ligase
MRTFGVEEELLIVDPDSGQPLALADALLAGHRLAADDAPPDQQAGRTRDHTANDDEKGLSA